jgi:hypothetical protein
MMKFCALVILVVVGCEQVSPRPDITDISYGWQGYDDLPVPEGFTFDDSDRSWAYRRYENTALNLRVGQFRYVGDRDVGQLVNWYNQQMAGQQWNQVSKDMEKDGTAAHLVFSKEFEEAKVDIERESGPTRPEPVTVVLLTVGVASAGE